MPRGGNLWIEARQIDGKTIDDKTIDGKTPTDTPQIEIPQIEILVRDDGTGIAADVLPHIFEPFLTTKESGRGVGLGLAISRGIVERHRGHIKVQSEVSRGTTFTITLPARDPDLALAGAPSGDSEAAVATKMR
jgi:signal transduction histidine kinase